MITPSSPPTNEAQNVEENVGLSSSASSSSRLNTLSLSSRRLRPTSHKYATRRNSDELETNSPQGTRSILENALASRITLLLWLPLLGNETHRATPRTRTKRFVRGLFLLWTWFCIIYFTGMLCGLFMRAALGWRNARTHPSLDDPTNSPEAILSSLPLEHRLSKLSSLYPVPVSVSSFIFGPREHEGDAIVACLWTEELNLPRLHDWASSWLGPISLLVTCGGEPRSSAHNKLLTSLKVLSRTMPTVSFHVLPTQAPLYNFNAYINLARLFSPGSRVLLFPPQAMSLWSPLPISSTNISSSIVSSRGKGLIIPLREREKIAMSNSTIITDLSRAVPLPSSALLLDRESAPWCSERLFTMTARRSSTAEPSTLDTEMAAHWEECVWNVWLRAKGMIRVSEGEGWADPGGGQVANLPPAPDTAETRLRIRVAQRQRSETCVLVARELIAQGQWTESSTPKGSEDGDDEVGPGFVGPHERKTRSAANESSTAQWLRGICKETLDRWGREILD